MTYLLDTNVVSERRKRSPDPNVKRWLMSVSSDSLYVSVLVLGEIRIGIERVRRRDPEQAARLEEWLSKVAHDYADRVVPITEDVADTWGRLNYPDLLPFVDGLMAATALTHGWTLVTRNTKDVERTGVKLLDPFTR